MPKESYASPGSLMRVTQQLVEKENLLALYTDTGISFYWLRKFASGQFANPSVNRVQFLYEKLSGKKLSV